MLKFIIIIIFVLRYYIKFKKTILKIDFSNYVNKNVLYQYNDDELLHFVVFYNKNMLLIKCNYEIYDKKLFVIIKYLKH